MKKLLIFLMILIPLAVIFIVNVTVDIVGDIVTISVDKITLDTEDYVANINDKFKLTATVYPEGASDKRVNWSSSDENIAVVDSEGNVSFKAFGAVNIIATSFDGLKSASCRINITDTRVHNILIYAEKTTLVVGENTHVWANVVPSTADNQNYVLRSSNEDIISVNQSGFVVAKNVGSAIISATSLDGNYEASIEINVVIPVESMNINLSEKVITICNSSFYIPTIITPTNATNKKIIYSVSDETTATISSNGLLSFSKIGEVVAIATTEDGNKTDSVKVIYTGGYPKNLLLSSQSANFDVSNGKQSFRIEYTLEPNEVTIKNITYSSNNEEVATVSQNGQVEVLKGGDATITIKAQVGENEFVYDTVFISSKQQIKEISFENENVVTANNNFKLEPNFYPLDATEKDSIKFEITNGNASIVDNQLVFNEIGEATIRAYLERDLSIYAEIKVRFTDGYPTQIIPIKKNITLNISETENLAFDFLPKDCSNKEFHFEIFENKPKIENENYDVVSVDVETGLVQANHTGTATVRMFAKTTNNEYICCDFNIKVFQKIEEIKILVNEEVYEEFYISASNIIPFSISILPIEAELEEIELSLSNNNIARIVENKVYFNQAGKVTLVANLKNNKNISHSINLWSTGGYAIKSEISEIPMLIYGDNPFNLELLNFVPANATNKSFSISLSNQQSANGKDILSFAYNENASSANVSLSSSGSATLSITLAGSTSPIFTKDITVYQRVKNIEFLTRSGATPSTSIALKCNVYPTNSAVKDVNFTLDESFSNIAYIKDDTLIFYPSSNEKETVVVIATIVDIDRKVISKSIEITSTFGVVEMPEGNSLTLSPGNHLNVDCSSDVISSTYLDLEIIGDANIISTQIISNVVNITANNSGNCELKILLKDYLTHEVIKIISSIEISIFDAIEDIIINTDNLYNLNSVYYTGKAENEIEISILPSSVSIDSVDIETSDAQTAVYNKETGKLQFLKTGIVELFVTTKNASISKSIKVQYTAGNSISAKTSLSENNEIQLGSTTEVKLESYIPSNISLSIVNVEEIITSGNPEILEVENNEGKFFIFAKNSGNTNVKVTLSDGSEFVYHISVLSFIEKIELSFNDLTTANKNVTLKPILTPTNPTNKNIIFVSSNENIATVSKTGLVTFKTRGEVTITAYSEQNSSIFASARIYCTFGEITDFEINTSKLTLTVGESRLISISKIYPSNAIKPQFTYEILSSNSNNGSNLNVCEFVNGKITALNGGNATLSIKFIDSLGTIIVKNCEVTVIRQLESLSIETASELDKYQNYFVTSTEEIDLNILTSPVDSTIENLILTVDDENIASINGNKLHFNCEGIVKVTAICNNISSSLTIRHTKSAVSYNVSFNHSSTESSDTIKITMNAGEKITLSVKNLIPSDLLSPKKELTLYNNFPNNAGDVVCEFIGNTIYARKGGTAKFKIEVAGKEYGKYLEIEVLKKATQIKIDSVIKTPNSVYKLNPSILPLDSSFKTLTYTFNNPTTNATLSSDGTITFNAESSVEILIKNEFSGISKIITVEYSKGFKSIEFNCVDYVFIGKTLNLSVSISPSAFENEPIGYTIPDEYKQYATISENGILTPGKSEIDNLPITAYLINYPEITAEIKISIYAIITDINMFDDTSRDNVGIEGKRVYGTTFLKDTEVIDITQQIDYFTLNYSVKYNSKEAPKLIITSSNPEIATVTNGVVKVIKEGKTTIKIEPRKQLGNNPKEYIYDSYTFEFVKGVNVTNEYEFICCVINHDINIVLQNNIDLMEKDIDHLVFKKNVKVYGNGYIVKFKRYFDLLDNVNLRNVTFRGYDFTAGQSLTVLNINCGPTMFYASKATGIKLDYCIFENCNKCIEVKNASLEVNGCIFNNTYNAGILLYSDEDNHTPNNLTVNSCVFENNMLGAVANLSLVREISETKSYTKFKGFLDMYNWIPVSVFTDLNYGDADLSMFKELISSKITPVINRNKSLLKTYNNQDYVFIGTLSMEAEFDLEGIVGLHVVNNATYEFDINNSQYTMNVIYEPISSGYMKLSSYGLNGSSTSSIQPGSSYKPNAKLVYEKIRRYVG